VQRRYVHGLASEIRIDAEKAVICSSRAAIAAAVTAGELTGNVPTFTGLAQRKRATKLGATCVSFRVARGTRPQLAT
jgi:hypothetical protein